MTMNFHRFFRALKATVIRIFLPFIVVLPCVSVGMRSGGGSGFLDEVFSSWLLYGMSVINQIKSKK